MYVRHDSVRKPLQRPYDGPFLVLEKKEKYFTTKKNGQPYSVSVDRLKPAFQSSLAEFSSPVPLPASTPTPTPAPVQRPPPPDSLVDFPPLPLPTHTSFGRISRPPDRFHSVLCLVFVFLALLSVINLFITGGGGRMAVGRSFRSYVQVYLI